MAWTDPNSFVTRLFSGDPYIILLAFLVALSLPILLHLYFYTTSGRAPSVPEFVLLGPSGSGKTSLLSLLHKRSADTEADEANLTRTSQVQSTVTLQLPSYVSLGSNKYRSKNDASLQDVEKNRPTYKIIDTPGHGKLRQEHALLALQNPAVQGILYVVDASILDNTDSGALNDAASYLHDVLLSLQRRKTGKGTSTAKQEIPVLIAANKQDLFTALPAGAVKDRLQTEIERIRQSRQKGITTVGKEDEADDEEILGGAGEEKFSFRMMEDEYNVNVEVLGGAVRGEEAGKGVRRWEEWIGGLL